MEVVRSLLGVSPAIRQVLDDAAALAGTDSKVLITGESGVGKEVLARIIHRRSRRANTPLVTINCAGVPESLLESELFGHMRGSFTGAHRDRRGLLEMADGGTVLLDEVGEMTLRMQGMLLRFLENGEIQRVGSERAQTVVNVRVIAATNRDLLEQVRRKEFREDLYYRLNIVHLVMPPLRERREDIKLLFAHYVEEFSRHHQMAAAELTPEAMAALEQHDWPGNVRELKNVAERLVLTRRGQVVTPADLPLRSHPRAASAASAGTPAVATNTPEAIADACFERMTTAQESFWTVVYEPFMLRDMTRETVRAVVRRGLQQTRGNYRLVAQLFSLAPQDYKRFLNFLQKYECHMPFQKFRVVAAGIDRDRDQPPDHAKAV